MLVVNRTPKYEELFHNVKQDYWYILACAFLKPILLLPLIIWFLLATRFGLPQSHFVTTGITELPGIAMRTFFGVAMK